MAIFDKQKKKVYLISRGYVKEEPPQDKIRTSYIDKEIYKNGELEGYITDEGLTLEKNYAGELWKIGGEYDSDYASFDYADALEKATEWFYEDLEESMGELKEEIIGLKDRISELEKTKVTEKGKKV